MKQTIIEQAPKTATAVSGTLCSFVTLNELVAIATLLYILFQVYVLAYKHYYDRKDRKNGYKKQSDGS